MSKKHIITLGGLPGSGKSTVMRLLMDELGYKGFSTGSYARHLAIERGLTLEQFNDLTAQDKSIDIQIDAEQKRIGNTEDHYVIDSILGFHFIPDAFRILLTVPLEVSASRIFSDQDSRLRKETGDSALTIEQVAEKTRRRIENHEIRYQDHYGVTVYDAGNYDLVIDTENLSPTAVAEIIMANYKIWLGEAVVK